MNLPANHLRSVSVALQYVEKSTDELLQLFLNQKNENTYQIVNDIHEVEIADILTVLKQLKQKIKELNEKYKLNHEVLYTSRVYNAKKAKIWEILSDTNSRRLRGYGNLDDETAKEIDHDMKDMLNLIEELYK